MKLILAAFAIGSITPALSVELYYEVPYERTVFKGLGAGLILAAFLSLWKTRDLSLQRMGSVLFLSLSGIFLTLSISALLWDFSMAIPLFLRFVSSLLIILFLINLTGRN